ncbi:MAG: coenzyme F420-0:L-glutamate ligase, partial [Defluviitaleaceae bacterium]|nr:coenzyme F420-0:L-glutamate ligase [Defluviitaleaceae bacterium]
MRHTGVTIYGIRTPLISEGDDLPAIAADSLCAALAAERLELKPTDIVGVTEAVVAKAQGNFAHIDDIAADIRDKYGDNTVGVVFPILSRNRFLNTLKGVCLGAKRVCVLLQLPHDEVGNPIMDIDLFDELEDELIGLLSADEFRRIIGGYRHPFTGVDYIELYSQISDNIEIYLSHDPRDILKLTPHVLVAEVHSRERTKTRLLRAKAKTVYTLADILREPRNGSGYNPDYGVMGSNMSTGVKLKLFPRDC